MSYEIIKFDIVSSTNDIAKELAESGSAEGTVIVADVQTSGRGRLGRSFLSPDGGLYMSVVLRPDSFETAVSVTTHAAVSAALAIEKHTGQKSQIKWVNDIYLDNKKVCGILAEAVFDGAKPKYVILGIGINLKSVPQEVSDIAGCIGDISRDELIESILDEYFCGTWNCHEEYTKRDMLKGSRVTVYKGGNSEYTATALGISPDFGLKLLKADGTEEILQSGEVSVRL